MWDTLLENIYMCQKIVKLIIFCIKGIPVTQYGSIDLVDSVMLFHDSTW